MRRREFIVGAAALLAASAARASPVRRLVTLGGAVTETVFALGAGAEVVGVDVSSVFPAEVRGRAQLGYYRQLSAEGVIGLAPTAVLTTEEAGPPAALSQIASAGIPLHTLSAAHGSKAAVDRIVAIGKAVERESAARTLAGEIGARFDEAARLVAAAPSRPRVLFLYARGAGAVTVSGSGTAADAMIGLAGGVNAVTEFEGYRPLTPEAAIGAAADVVLVTTLGLESVGGEANLWALPGLSLLPAARTRRLVVRDDLTLLGFGPRAGMEACELFRALHAEARQ